MKLNLRFLMLALLCAVFSTTWGQTTTEYTLTISTADFNGTSYTANNGSHTSNAVCTTNPSKTYEVTWQSNQVMLQNNKIQFQKNAGYIYNTTSLGVITKIELINGTEIGNPSVSAFNIYYGNSENPKSGEAGESFFTIIANKSNTATCSSIEITFTVEDTNDQPTGDTYDLLSSQYNLVEGDYIITYSGKAMSNTVESNMLGYKEPTIEEGNITTADNTIVWHIAPSETPGYWTIKSLDNNEYVASTGNDNEATTTITLDDKALWSTSGTYSFTNKATGIGLHYQGYNFYCTRLGAGVLSLYRKHVNVATPDFTPSSSKFIDEQSVEINCDTPGAFIYYTTDGTTPTSSSTLYEGAFTINTTTTVKAIAIIADDESEVAEATFTKLVLMTISEVRTQNIGTTIFTQGVVTSIYDQTAYIQDATAAICLYGDPNLTVGDEITVKGDLVTFHDLLEISNPICTSVSQNNTMEPTVMTIADINSSTNQGWLVKIENATVSSINNKSVTLAQGENTILVRFNDTSDINFVANDIITLTGNIGCYDGVQIANPRDITIKGDKYYVAGTWTNWQNSMIEMTKNTNGTYTLANQELDAEAEFQIVKVAEGAAPVWYHGDSNDKYWVTNLNHTALSLIAGSGQNFYMPIAGTWTFTVNPTGDAPTLTVDGNWPVLDFYLVGNFNDWAESDDYKFSKNSETGKYTISKSIELGEKFKIIGSDGTWYGAVSNGDFYVEENLVGTGISLSTPGENFYMNLSNKNQWGLEFDPLNMKLVLSNYASNIAELPFMFDAGKNVIPNTNGLTQSGLGSDYNNSPKLKFDDTDDALILHFDERPGTLSFDVKGNTFSGGTFSVQTSEDGVNYTDLKNYTNPKLSDTTLSEEFNNLDANVRYIRWLYKARVNGNVALGNIVLEEYKDPQPYTVTITDNEHADVTVSSNDTEIESGGQVFAPSEVLVSVSVSKGYELESLTVTKENGREVDLTEGENDNTWTFIMPNSNVTVACTVKEFVEPTDEEWVLTDLADLTAGDIFVIVGDNGATYAMSNDNGASSAPTAVAVTVSDDKIISSVADNIKWSVSGNATDGYSFYPNGNVENWLYTFSNNNGLRVGTGDDKVFTIEEDFLYNVGQQRYIGIYNSQDWRSYTSINNNIKGQTFAFYKRVVPQFTFTINAAATDGTSCYATISALGEGNWKIVGNVEVSTVVVENNVLTYPKVFTDGELIPGNGAFLVKGAAGEYTFDKAKSTKTIDLGDNMLMSTGEGNFLTRAPEGDSNTPYLFYKLARNGSDAENSIGFYFGAANGAAFTYGKGHQAYLAVPNPTGGTGVQSFAFDGTGTGINYIVTVPSNENEVYTLSGMRVNSDRLQKGIYIVNGKKVVIK